MSLDLTVSLGGLSLANPVMNASGTFGYGGEWPRLCETARLGAIVTKTLTLAPRAGNPPPRLHETASGLMNSIGLENVGVEAFLRDYLPGIKKLGPRVIASVGGEAPSEYARCVERLEDSESPPDAYEINISCPNVAAGGLSFGRSETDSARVVRDARAKTRRPLFVKLTPNVTDIVAIGRACVAEGADGLTAVNTFLGMAVDVDREHPIFARVGAGVSGPAIMPLALHRVYELAQALPVPLIGAGGIVTARDALAFLLAGASAVQVGTATLRDPARPAALVDEIAQLLEEKHARSVREVIGRLHRASRADPPGSEVAG